MNNKFYFYISPNLNNEFHKWIINYLVEIIGLIPIQQNKLTKKTHLVYGEYDSANNSEKINIPHNPTDLLNEAILKGENKKDLLKNFDIISAIGNFLTDTVNENKNKHCYDKHNRLNALNSYQYSVGFRDKPIINLYINFLKSVIDDCFKLDIIPLLPDGIKSVVILSHDVDDPEKYAMLKSYKLFPKNLSIKNFILHQLEAIKKTTERLIKKDAKTYWVFNEVMDSEEKYGFLSTFFFAARNKYDKYANFKEDVPYDIEREEFSAVFKMINDRNFEVGLHASYNAHKEKNLLIEEKYKLEQLSNKKLIGNRHHFWQIGKKPEQTLKVHLQAELLYDSSLAFNDAPGFRRNIALPYFLFDKELNQKVNNMQIPTFMMDSNFMLNPEFSEDEALNQAKHYINEFHKIGGVGAIDWHVRTSFAKNSRFKKWGDTYLEILEYLSLQEGMWVTNFETFYNWMIKRKETLYNLN